MILKRCSVTFNFSLMSLIRSDHDEAQKWFLAKAWLHGWAVVPDASIDMAAFYQSYFTRNALWDRAFHFLGNEDLEKMEIGDLILEENDLIVKVQEYFTKDEHDTKYEAHRRYADIQYLVFGSERIGIIGLEKTKVIVPYDDASDVVFLESGADQYRHADKRSFFIFFPGDAHRPCLRDGESTLVRKIVIKVRID